VLVSACQKTNKQYSARVYKFIVLCSGFALISGTISRKSEVDMSTPVYAVATSLNACRASRARGAVRVAPYGLPDKHDTSRHDVSCAKMHGLYITCPLLCCDVTQEVEFWLYYRPK